MTTELKDNFFTQYGKYLSLHDNKKNSLIPFSDHPQFPILVDILSRKEHHHAILCADFSPTLHHLFMDAFLQHLTYDTIPHHLRGVNLLYLNLDNALFTEIKHMSIEKDFEAMRDALNTTDKYLVVVLTRADLFTKEPKKADERFLRRQLDSLLAHPKCRFLLFIQTHEYQAFEHLDYQFSFLNMAGPTTADVLSILKQQRLELELYHHVLIPEELLTQAYSYAERYLDTNNALENALRLLDSSAARAGAVDQSDANNQFKPVLTTATLTNVLSTWTQIPATHLHLDHFKTQDFTQGMQQKVFGQDTAITILAQELLQAQAHRLQKTGPFCSFLFAGPAHAGKKTMALALVEQLFKQLNVLYYAQPSLALNAISDVKVQRCFDKHYVSLKEVIRQTPYAVFVFENIEQASPAVLEGLQDIITTGYMHDETGHPYNFSQAIIILSTTAGSNYLVELASLSEPQEDHYTLDLMQLVMGEQKSDHPHLHQDSPQEMIAKTTSEIAALLPSSLCQNVLVIPFLPLNGTAVEKIIRQKLKLLGKQLDARYGIELGYAPEVIRYLANEILTKRENDNQSINPDKSLKQLYYCVDQAIVSQVDNKNRPNQLFLQLNETGQLLRCDWLAVTPMRHHAT